jgi:hypothetical protein
MSILTIILNIFIPPLGVGLAKGFGKDFINLILTLIFFDLIEIAMKKKKSTPIGRRFWFYNFLASFQNTSISASVISLSGLPNSPAFDSRY